MKNRRQFISTFGALGAASLCRAATDQSWLPHPRHVQVWRTEGADRHAFLSTDAWSASSRSSCDTTVNIHSHNKKQTLYGIGGALTDSTCYLLSLLSEDDKRHLLTELFSPSGLGLSLCRICVGSSDFSRYAYSYDESEIPDPALTHFSIAHDMEYIIPCLLEARKINPQLRLLATPWSPPGWMKTGGSLLGGMMQKRYFDAYAAYLIHFILAYRDAGVIVDALSVQNEVDTDQDGRMPACLWGQEYEIQFVADHLGPALKAAHLDVKIMILDHNYNLWGRVLDQLGDSRFAQYVDGVAWHAYGGGPEAMSRVHAVYPTKDMFWTEGGPDVTDPTYMVDWCRWSTVFTGVLNNWSRSIITWNILLDENGRPRIGPFACGGLLTRNSHTGRLSRSGQYWALSHFSPAITANTQILKCSLVSSSPTGINAVAFSTTSGQDGVILTNTGQETNVLVETVYSRLVARLSPDSITTFMWESHA